MSTQMPNENNEKEPSLDVIRLMLDIKTNVTGADVEALADAAVREGDHETAAVCRDALDGDQAAWYACGEYILETRAARMGAPRREPTPALQGIRRNR
jgi:hypothetical protein